ncbi:unnamed protein product [Microthlaspi erraticum]|uniref:Uncharacterized protein n=1 Tax=Microthlaspi erraticum TaxID=1685480 RepID=A0A6D2K0U7_9BRAS|nr:unnamed protein product [Microthlaspi erraticum]
MVSMISIQSVGYGTSPANSKSFIEGLLHSLLLSFLALLLRNEISSLSYSFLRTSFSVFRSTLPELLSFRSLMGHLQSPKNGPRQRASHSERHQPVTGFFIEEISRIVSQTHSQSTKKKT